MRHDEKTSAIGRQRAGFLRRQSRGQTLVEMAIAVPLLVIFLFGVVEMGRLFFAWVTVQHAARVGARYAVTGQGEQQGNRVQLVQSAASAAAANLPAGSVNISVRSWNGTTAVGAGQLGDAGDPCDVVEVEVQYTYRPVIPLIAHFLPSQIVLRGKDRKLNEPWTPCP